MYLYLHMFLYVCCCISWMLSITYYRAETIDGIKHTGELPKFSLNIRLVLVGHSPTFSPPNIVKSNDLSHQCFLLYSISHVLAAQDYLLLNKPIDTIKMQFMHWCRIQWQSLSKSNATFVIGDIHVNIPASAVCTTVVMKCIQMYVLI